jgi:hypothetical protein
VVLFVVVFYVPQFLQAGQGLGALDAGLIMLPPALMMGVFMAISGQVVDRIGPRWPAFVGFTIAAIATYLLRSITLDTSREELMWLLMLQFGGLGIGMMPLFSGGLAVIPTAHANTASAFNNVVQRTAAALGVAVFTAILTIQEAQQVAGRTALTPADTPTPTLGPTAPPGAGLYATYQQTELQVFVAAISNLFLLASVLYAVCALGALLFRSGPGAPAGLALPQQAAAPAVPVVTFTATPDKSRPTRQTDGLAEVEDDARLRKGRSSPTELPGRPLDG